LKSSIKGNIPNVLTACRIIGSLSLIFLTPFTIVFSAVYIFCGLTDMADGFIARRLNCSTKLGGTLDGIADFVFLTVCIIKLFKLIHIPLWIIIWVLIIFIVKIVNTLLGIVKEKQIVFLHTSLNKITGLLLFIFPLATGLVDVNISSVILCVVASAAAVNENYIITRNKEKLEM